MAKVSFLNSYRSKNKGVITFRYKVSGTKAQLDAYKTAQGTYYRVSDATGDPLWFTTKFIGNQGSLIITEKGKVIPDMSAYEQAESLSKQFGGDFGAEIAKASAQAILAGMGMGSAQPTPAPTAVPKAQPESTEEIDE